MIMTVTLKFDTTVVLFWVFGKKIKKKLVFDNDDEQCGSVTSLTIEKGTIKEEKMSPLSCCFCQCDIPKRVFFSSTRFKFVSF